MSRVGKKPVPVPAGVTLTLNGSDVAVKGPKGELKFVINAAVNTKLENGQFIVEPRDESKFSQASWGMVRSMIVNMITGVTAGFSKTLEINGVGYRASVQGKNLMLNLGYSHDVVYAIPDGIAIVTPKPTEIIVSGIDKQRVGQVAAEIREWREPEPYKGKGIKYSNETIFRKEGKKK